MMGFNRSFSLTWISTLLLLLCMAATVNCTNEVDVLLQLKSLAVEQLSDWDNNSGIISHCNWSGISCNPITNSVISIDLTGRNISAQIPDSFGSLRSLTHLNMSNNYFTGRFPTSLLNCTSLQTLKLSNNLFTGPLPAEIHFLGRLELLDLSFNEFSGEIPDEFGLLNKIETLYLSNNNLSGRSSAQFLGNLSRLKYLDLSSNQLDIRRIPEEIFRLSELRELDLSNCKLSGEIPVFLMNLTNLEVLDLENNYISGNIPVELLRLSKLKVFDFSSNFLRGTIASNISSLQNLEHLGLSWNQMSGEVPHSIGKLVNLKHLVLHDNYFSGTIPDVFANMQNLQLFMMWKNNFSGPVPRSLGACHKLVSFAINENSLSGPFPQEDLCKGKNLQAFLIFSNKINGSLPEFLGRCSSLGQMYADNNELSGHVPDGLWSLPYLRALRLQNNFFHGDLPSALAPNLCFLDISCNRFSGSIPDGIGLLSNLKKFYASRNNFSGIIPSGITNLNQLAILALDHNGFSGEIPSTINFLKNLDFLDLSYNFIAGRIPEALAELRVLGTLLLQHNNLSGDIPSDLGKLKLNTLNLSENSFQGSIPSEFNSLAYQRSFLGNTGLCGEGPLKLPACHYSLSSISVRQTAAVIYGFLLLICILIWLICILRKKSKSKSKSRLCEWKMVPFCAVEFCEMDIVQGLHKDNIIGSGGSGIVYKVTLPDANPVAVKKIHNNGANFYITDSANDEELAPPANVPSIIAAELEAELTTSASIKHSNIVKILCCISGLDSTLLVYEFMQNGSLFDRLHDSESGANSFLTQERRLDIAIDAARGLCYLHHGCCPPIIHRDVKSANILLDSEFRAYIGDFGLARRFHCEPGEKELMTTVAGSYGYMAPEYTYTLKINEKIDVYSFGVVLLELGTGKKADDEEFGSKGRSIVTWVLQNFNAGKILDPRMPLCNPSQILAMLRVGLLCTHTLSEKRPSMKEVVEMLLFVKKSYMINNKYVMEGDFVL